MSEATRRERHVHEVTSETPPDCVASRLAEHGSKYLKVIAGIPVAMKAPYDVSTKEGRTLSWAYANRAASVANSNIMRGKQKDLSDADKQAWLTAYMNGGYKFTDDLGAEFSSSLLETAADRVFFELGVAQGKFSGKHEDHVTPAEREKRAGMVQKILTDPSLADKYTPQIEAMVATMLAERHAIQTRTRKGDEAPLDIEL